MKTHKKIHFNLIIVIVLLGFIVMLNEPILAATTNSYNGFYYQGDWIYRSDYDIAGQLDIPETLDGNKITRIGEGAFESRDGLTGVSMPDSIVSIGAYAFDMSHNIQNFVFSANIERIGEDAFRGTAWYDNLPDGLVYIGKVLYSCKGDCSKEPVINVRPGTTMISANAFSGCTGLKKITIPDSVIEIGEAAFFGCTSLTEVVLPSQLNEIPEKVFWRCSSLQNISLPKGLSRIGSISFSECTSLSEIEIPKSVIDIDYAAFSGCTKINSITLPTGLIHLGSQAFYGTSWLESQPDGLVYIGNVAYTYRGSMPYDYCCEIAPDTKVLADNLFYDNNNLKEITLPEGLECIGRAAFSHCKSLSKIILPSTIKQIDETSFWECNQLKTICYCASPEKWQEINWSFDGGEKRRITPTVYNYVPSNDSMLIVDTTSKISVTGPDNAYDGEPTLRIDPITAPEITVSLLKQTYEKTTAYDISTLLNGKAAQPSAPVTVTIPLPDGYQAATTEVYHITSDGKAEKMAVTVSDGVISFLTTGFSVFVIVDSATEVKFELGNVDSDQTVSSADARLALRASVKLENYAPFSREFSAADVNNDGKIGADDARTILRVSVKLEAFG